MLLKLENIAKMYGALDSGPQITVLNGISLEVDAGESAAIVGPSGSGKSTLLNIIGALDRPTSGRALLDGQDLSTLSDKELASIRSRKIGFVFQLHHLLPQCSVIENVLVPTIPLGGDSDPESAQKRAIALLERVGLGARMDHRPAQLSGGECQRVAVVRALINRPKLILADEPTGSLDHASAEKLGQLLVELNREENGARIVVTHSKDLARLMGKTFSLLNGRLTSQP